MLCGIAPTRSNSRSAAAHRKLPPHNEENIYLVAPKQANTILAFDVQARTNPKDEIEDPVLRPSLVVKERLERETQFIRCINYCALISFALTKLTHLEISSLKN